MQFSRGSCTHTTERQGSEFTFSNISILGQVKRAVISSARCEVTERRAWEGEAWVSLRKDRSGNNTGRERTPGNTAEF